MNSDRAKRRLALVGLILFSALALGIMSTQASDATIAGRARASDVANPVAQIGSETVTTDDFAAQVTSVQSNLSYMRGEIAAGNPSSAFLQAFIDIITTHGIKNVAFAGLIEDHALYEQAVARGFNPSDAVVNAKVAQDKALAARAIDSANAAYIASVGEQKFWTTMYPAMVRRSLATQALWQSRTSGKATDADRVTTWQQVQQQAVASTEVRVLDASAIAPASTDSAMAYLQDYWQFSAQ
jgi:hypothetical protein